MHCEFEKLYFPPLVFLEILIGRESIADFWGAHWFVEYLTPATLIGDVAVDASLPIMLSMSHTFWSQKKQREASDSSTQWRLTVRLGVLTYGFRPPPKIKLFQAKMQRNGKARHEKIVLCNLSNSKARLKALKRTWSSGMWPLKKSLSGARKKIANFPQVVTYRLSL